MNPNQADALEAFERLGLTSYEAKVFIALQRLGSGTARDVADVADVPRSQVYSVAESLEGRGLLEVQQASPIRYRPVSVDEARETLRDSFESEQERAFEYVEDVREEPGGEEEQEDIWTVRGRSRIDDRVVDVLSSAQERIIFGVRCGELLTDDMKEALESCATDSIDVRVISRSPAVREQLSSLTGIPAFCPPDDQDDEVSGRIVIVDDDSVLLSVVDEDGSETAIWSAGSLFASVLIQLIEANAESFDEAV